MLQDEEKGDFMCQHCGGIFEDVDECRGCGGLICLSCDEC